MEDEEKAIDAIDAAIKTLVENGGKVLTNDCVERTSRANGTKSVRLTLDMGKGLVPAANGDWA
jgi:hypothetical protein